MAQIILTIPDAVAVRVNNGVAYANGYNDFITDINGSRTANPETKIQFNKRILIRFIKDSIKRYEGIIATNTADSTVNQDIDTNIVIS